MIVISADHRPAGLERWERYVLLLLSLLPLSLQSTAYTGHTQWEARMQGSLYDSVCKGQLEGAQSRAEKDQEWTWEILVGVQQETGYLLGMKDHGEQ